MNLANIDFLKLDPRCFKAFVAAAEFENFTLAADAAAMTQSGVSQHVSKLEEQLGVTLFMRSSRATVLTEQGRTLLDYIRTYNDSVTALLDALHRERALIEGIVSYAMPPSCLLSPHFSMMLERRREHPALELNVQLLPNNDILPLLIDGKIDFGFVTERVEHPSLSYLSFCDEEYLMVGSDASRIAELAPDNLLEGRYINYPGMGVYFNYWIMHHMPACRHVSNRSLHHAGEMNSISGAILMAAGGLGLAVFPRHCVERQIERDELFTYRGDGREPLLNTIYIVSRKSPEPPARVATVIDWFMDMNVVRH